MQNRLLNRPHIYRAPDDAAASALNATPTLVTQAAEAMTLQKAKNNFVEVMNRHVGAMLTLFNKAHKNRPRDILSARSDNDAVKFKERLEFIIADAESYTTNPEQDFLGFYAKQEKRHTALKDTFRELRLYCEKENIKHYIDTIEKEISDSHIVFCRMQATHHPLIKKIERGIHRYLSATVKDNLKRISQDEIPATVNAFMSTVHAYPNYLSIYQYIRTIIRKQTDSTPVRSAIWDFYSKDPKVTLAFKQFAREGAEQLAPVIRRREKAALSQASAPISEDTKITEEAPKPVQARSDGKYGPHDSTPRSILEKRRLSIIPKDHALLTDKDSKAINALTSSYIPVKAPVKNERIAPQRIQSAAPIGNMATKPKWHQRLRDAVYRKAIIVTTAVAAAAVMIVAAISFIHQPSKVKIAGTYDAPTQISAAQTSAPAQTSPAPAAAPTLNVPLSDAPTVTSNDFPAAKPTPLQQAVKNTLAAGPSVSVTPSWAAQGTLGVNMNGLSDMFADQAQSAPEPTIVEKPVEKTTAKPATDTPAKANSALAKVQTAQTGEQISDLFAKIGGKKLKSVTYDEGQNKVEADFGNDKEEAFNMVRKLSKSGKVIADEIRVYNGVVTLKLKK